MYYHVVPTNSQIAWIDSVPGLFQLLSHLPSHTCFQQESLEPVEVMLSVVCFTTSYILSASRHVRY